MQWMDNFDLSVWPVGTHTRHTQLCWTLNVYYSVYIAIERCKSHRSSLNFVVNRYSALTEWFSCHNFGFYCCICCRKIVSCCFAVATNSFVCSDGVRVWTLFFFQIIFLILKWPVTCEYLSFTLLVYIHIQFTEYWWIELN